jgi:hypothetical protein
MAHETCRAGPELFTATMRDDRVFKPPKIDIPQYKSALDSIKIRTRSNTVPAMGIAELIIYDVEGTRFKTTRRLINYNIIDLQFPAFRL